MKCDVKRYFLLLLTYKISKEKEKRFDFNVFLAFTDADRFISLLVLNPKSGGCYWLWP